MKRSAVAICAACAAMLVVACASAPRATVSRAASSPAVVELFDSRAVAAEPVAAAEQLLDLPVPPSTPGKSSAAAAAPVVPAATRAAVPTGGPDASLREPARPTAGGSFQLAAPAIPPVVTAAAAPSKPAGTRSVPAKPAPEKAPPAPPPAPTAPPRTAPTPPAPRTSAVASSGAQGANVRAAGAPSADAPGASPANGAAAASASAAGASSASGSGAATSYGRLREIYARQGDELQIGLDGVGFLFLGLADSQADGMAFKSKENRANRTLFTFQALKLGTYDLDFLQQDNMAGKTSRETVRVHVVSDQDFAAATAGQPAADPGAAGSGAGDSGDPAFAQRLAAAGSYSAAVAELLKGYKDGNPGLNDQIANAYLQMGSYDAAGKYWSKNLQPQTDFTTRAVVGLFRLSVLQNDQPGLLAYLRPFLSLNDAAMEEPLVQAVRMEKSRAEFGLALDLAGEYTRRFSDGRWRDEVDFLTAQLLEADSQFRDIARARQLYQSIVTDRPESPYADRARLRVQYIDRHFLQVR